MSSGGCASPMGVRSECRAEPARWPQCITNLSADPDWLGRDVAKTLIATCAMDTGARCVFCINNSRQQPYGPSLAGALKVCKSLPGFRSAPGGQLVQESDVSAPVRGARLVLADLEGVRANMSASWLAQMGWDVWVLDGAQADDFNEVGPSPSPVPEPQGPIAWASPAQLAQAVARIPIAQRYVLTCGSSLLARYAATDLARLTGAEVVVLQGGTLAWIEAGLPLEQGETHPRLSPHGPLPPPLRRHGQPAWSDARLPGLGVWPGGPVGARWHAWISRDLSCCINGPGDHRADSGFRLNRSAARSSNNRPQS